MKFETEAILGMAALCVFMVLMFAVIICVLTENIVGALVAFVPALVCIAAANAYSIEYELYDYYYEEDELD